MNLLVGILPKQIIGHFTIKQYYLVCVPQKRYRGYKLFSGLNILDSRLRGSDSDEGFVIPAEAGGKQPLGDSDSVFIL